MLSADGQNCQLEYGATRLYGYLAEEVLGQQISRLHMRDDNTHGKPDEELRRAAAEERLEAEGWRVRWDGSRSWANVVTVALRDPAGPCERSCRRPATSPSATAPRTRRRFSLRWGAFSRIAERR